MFELLWTDPSELLYVVCDKRTATINQMQRYLCVQEIFWNCLTIFNCVELSWKVYKSLCLWKVTSIGKLFRYQKSWRKKITQFTSDGGNRVSEIAACEYVEYNTSLVVYKHVFSRCIIYQVNFVCPVYFLQ